MHRRSAVRVGPRRQSSSHERKHRQRRFRQSRDRNHPDRVRRRFRSSRGWSGRKPYYQVFFQRSVPLLPRSVRRSQLPDSEPSGLICMVRMTVLPLVHEATASTLPTTSPTPTILPLSHSSSSAPDGASEMPSVCSLTYGLPLVSVPVTAYGADQARLAVVERELLQVVRGGCSRDGRRDCSSADGSRHQQSPRDDNGLHALRGQSSDELHFTVPLLRPTIRTAASADRPRVPCLACPSNATGIRGKNVEFVTQKRLCRRRPSQFPRASSVPVRIWPRRVLLRPTLDPLVEYTAVGLMPADHISVGGGTNSGEFGLE